MKRLRLNALLTPLLLAVIAAACVPLPPRNSGGGETEELKHEAREGANYIAYILTIDGMD